MYVDTKTELFKNDNKAYGGHPRFFNRTTLHYQEIKRECKRTQQ